MPSPKLGSDTYGKVFTHMTSHWPCHLPSVRASAPPFT